MTRHKAWLLYGATGYTGRNIAKTAIAKGYAPVLAGRNHFAIKALAQELGLAWRIADLADAAQLKAFDLAATIAQKVHDGWVRSGFQTAASLFGEGFILEFGGCRRENWPQQIISS